MHRRSIAFGVFATAITAVAFVFWPTHPSKSHTPNRQLDLSNRIASASKLRARNHASSLWQSEATDWVDLTPWKGDLAPLFKFELCPTQSSIPEDVITAFEVQSNDATTETFELIFRGAGTRLCVRHDGADYDRAGEFLAPAGFNLQSSGNQYSETYELYEMIRQYADHPLKAREHLDRVRQTSGLHQRFLK